MFAFQFRFVVIRGLASLIDTLVERLLFRLCPGVYFELRVGIVARTCPGYCACSMVDFIQIYALLYTTGNTSPTPRSIAIQFINQSSSSCPYKCNINLSPPQTRNTFASPLAPQQHTCIPRRLRQDRLPPPTPSRLLHRRLYW